MNKSWNLNALTDDLTGPFRAALESVDATKREDGMDNINLLRRGNGLPERRRGGPNLTEFCDRNDDMVDFNESQRKDRLAKMQMESDALMTIPALMVIVGTSFLMGVGFVLLAQWVVR